MVSCSEQSCAAAAAAAMALARTGNVNAGDLYTFFTNDTNAYNNIVSIGGQVSTKTMQRLPKYFMKTVH